jgi:hypothetical protein
VRENVGRPSGTCVVIPLYPALKRGAKLGRPADLSHAGCYIELMMPLSVGTPIQATLWLDGHPTVIRGRVITCHPQYGNGMMFEKFEDQAEQLLQQCLDGVLQLRRGIIPGLQSPHRCCNPFPKHGNVVILRQPNAYVHNRSRLILGGAGIHYCN